MKTGKLLVVDADAVSSALVAQAAKMTGHDLLEAQTSGEAFHFLADTLGEVNVIVVDADPGVHGLAVLAAMDVAPTAPPVIVLTSLGEIYMTPIGAARGAAACLGKPFSAEKLADVIEQVSAPAFRSATCTSDAWGHPHRCQNSFVACPGCRHQTREPSETPAVATT